MPANWKMNSFHNINYVCVTEISTAAETSSEEKKKTVGSEKKPQRFAIFLVPLTEKNNNSEHW